MTEKEKLRRLIEQGHDYYYSDSYKGANVYEAIAEYLTRKGVLLKESGRLKGVTYEDGNITEVHIQSEDDTVKVFSPTRHGRWEEWDDGFGGTYYRCSVCSEDWCTIDGTPAENSMRYCPQCGAMMDGDTDV